MVEIEAVEEDFREVTEEVLPEVALCLLEIYHLKVMKNPSEISSAKVEKLKILELLKTMKEI